MLTSKHGTSTATLRTAGARFMVEWISWKLAVFVSALPCWRDQKDQLPQNAFTAINGNPIAKRRCFMSKVCLGQSHSSKDKVKQAKCLLSAWGLLVRLGPHKDKVRQNIHSARRPHLASRPASEIAFPA